MSLRTMLLVEDLDATAASMIDSLSSHAPYFAVTRARGVVEAQELLKRHRFEIVVSDLDLEPGYGTTVLKYAVEQKQGASLYLYASAMELNRDITLFLQKIDAELIDKADFAEAMHQWHLKTARMCILGQDGACVARANRVRDTSTLGDLWAEVRLAVLHELRGRAGVFQRVTAIETTWHPQIERGGTSPQEKLAQILIALLLERKDEAIRLARGLARAEVSPELWSEFVDYVLMLSNVPRLEDTARGLLFTALREPASAMTLVHISDLHFGNCHRFADVDGKQFDGTLTRHIIELIHHQERKNPGVPVVLVVSGDVADRADDGEYDRALKMLEGIRRETVVSRVIVVPGNHDVNWSLAEKAPERRFDPYWEFVTRFYTSDEIATLYPAVRTTQERRRDPWRMFSFHELPAARLLIVGFNSSIEGNLCHYGEIGPEQLHAVSEEIKRRNLEHWRKIAVMHHHATIVESQVATIGKDVDTDVTLVRDFAALEPWFLRNRFELVLHGHKHLPAVRRTSVVLPDSAQRVPTMTIAAAGTSGHRDPNPGPGNFAGVIQFTGVDGPPGSPFASLEWMMLSLAAVPEWKVQRELLLRHG